MGSIFSRWKSKPSTMEILESLEKEIESLEKLKRMNLEKQKKMIGSLLLYSVLLYVASAVFIYFYQWPRSWKQRLYYLTPLMLFPPIVWILKRFLHWYFVKRITKNESALEEKKEEKKKILEEVMEKETYKKAKEILEKFDPESFKKIEEPAGTPGKQQTPQQGLRQRKGGTTPQTLPPGSARPAMPSPTPGQHMGTPHLPPGTLPQRPRSSVPGAPGNARIQQQAFGTPGPPPPGPPMPRPILPRERSASEKLIEYLVGDGPQNRFALICRECMSHNGMALKEEFEYLAFRCCYCYSFNPARKERPRAPKPEYPTPVAQHHKPARSVQKVEDLKTAELSEEGELDEAELSEEDEEDTSAVGSKKQSMATDSGRQNPTQPPHRSHQDLSPPGTNRTNDVDMYTDDSDQSFVENKQK